MAEGLRVDGASAWGEAQALRARTGKTALPPPAWLLEPVPPLPAGGRGGAAARPPNPEAAIVAERVRSESDDGSLNSFLRQLVRRQPQAEAFEIAADEPPPAEAARAERGAAPPDSPALDRFLDQLGGRLAVGRPDPAEAPVAPTGEPARPPTPPPAPASGAPAAVRPPAVRPAPPPPRAAVPTAAAPARPATAPPVERPPPAALLPAPSPGGTLPAEARAELERVVETARRQGAGLEVVGHGATPALALERARAVARLVAEQGLPPGGLALRAAGLGERVELHLVPRPPS